MAYGRRSGKRETGDDGQNGGECDRRDKSEKQRAADRVGEVNRVRV